MVWCKRRLFLRFMVSKSMTPTSFFSWKSVGFIGIFVTSIGWTFYLSFLIMISIFENYDFFTASFESFGASFVLIFITIYASVSALISYFMYKRNMLKRNQYLLILGIAVIIGIVLNRIFKQIIKNQPKSCF